MSSSYDSPSGANAELWALVEAYCDGQASPAQRDALDAQLVNNSAACLFYLSYLQVHAELAWERRGSNESAATPTRSPILGLLVRTSAIFNRPVVWSILAVGIVFYGTFALFSWNLRPDKLPQRLAHFPKSSQENTPVPFADSAVVAMVSNGDDVRWSADTKPKSDDSPIHTGEPLKIDSGQIKLNLKRGAELLVEGPAEWSIDGDKKVSLRVGKMVARVPHDAIGFTIATASGNVVDLGTEFGVVTDLQGTTEVQVFDGQVEIQSASIAVGGRPLRLSRGAKAIFSDRGKPPVVERSVTPADLSRFEWAKSSMPGLARQIKAAKRLLIPVSIVLMNATASFSQSFYGGGVATTIDRVFTAGNGWAIAHDDSQTQAETAVWETTRDVSANRYTFTLSQLDTLVPQATIGRFRISVTTDDRNTFADELAANGDVSANWIELTPVGAIATNGATLTINKDNSILASGENPATSVYTITAVSPLLKVTGVRLEVLTDPSLPNGGPGRNTGNFVLTEFQMSAQVVPETQANPLTYKSCPWAVGESGVCLIDQFPFPFE